MDFLPSDTVFNVIFLFLLIVVVVAFSGLFLLIYQFVTRWISILQRDKVSGAGKIRQEAYEQASKILDDARQKSSEIINDANLRAKKTLTAVEQISDESKVMLGRELDNVVKSQANVLKRTSTELLKYYNDTLLKQKADSVAVLQKASEQIEKELLHEVEEFGDILKKETIDTQKQIEARIQKEYSTIEQDLADYKRKNLSAIDESIYDILYNVSKRVFGKALSMEEHQELVIEALEEAKKSNVFKPSEEV
jgi:hypothetical protein